jgi:hypothetical protein
MQTWMIKPSTARQLAEVYGVPYRVFQRHIKPIAHLIGKRIGYFYTVKQIMIIVENVGPPPFKEIIYPRFSR